MRHAWVSVEEAEQLTRKSARTLRRWAAAGRLEVQHDSEGRTLYHLADLNIVSGHGPTDRRTDNAPVSAPRAEVVQPDQRAPSFDQVQALQMARRLGELEAEAKLMREERDYWRAQARAITERAHIAECTLAQERTERTAVEAARSRLAMQVAGHDRPRPDTRTGYVSTFDQEPVQSRWWRLFRRLFRSI